MIRGKEAMVARLIVMRRGGGGKVAINPELVSHVRSAAGAFTDIFFEGHQVAVEGTFDEVVARLAAPERKSADGGRDERRESDGRPDVSLVFGRPGR